MNFETYSLARVIHVIAVILWIGGVAMVTTVIIPAVKRLKSKEDQIKTFEEIEGKFSFQAKITTLLTGLSGFYMLYELDGWNRYFDYQFWWIHAMTLVWILFTLVLYILEPLVLHKLCTFGCFLSQWWCTTFRCLPVIIFGHWMGFSCIRVYLLVWNLPIVNG